MTLHQPLYHFKADLFKGLGHPVRLRILELLREGEMSVSELQPHLGLELPNISQQLAVLRSAGLVTGRKQGSSVFYSVRSRLIFDLLDTARAMFEESLGNAAAMLDELRSVQAEKQSAKESEKDL